jgi:hypothetical protein
VTNAFDGKLLALPQYSRVLVPHSDTISTPPIYPHWGIFAHEMLCALTVRSWRKKLNMRRVVSF